MRDSEGLPGDERRVFLSTLPAGRGERRLALAVVLVSSGIFVVAAPFAKVPLGQVWAFIPMYESALVINDLITAVLLFGQFGILRSPALLVLAGGYLFTACMTVAHALTFPGLFSPTGLLGAGPQSTAWLYMFWHGGFPLLVMAYALLKDDGREIRRAQVAVPASVATVLVAVGGLTLLATAGQGALPAIMQGNHYTPAMIGTVSSVWSLSLLALAVLWWRRPHTVLDLWLMVVMCAWLFDIALAAVLNAGRFDLGFYAGRIYGLLAASFVLMVLLIENGRLYARLVEAYEGERRERQLGQERTAELSAANQELDAFAYAVSHDLRGPLRAMSGFSQALVEDYGGTLESGAREYLEQIGIASRRMGELIDGLLQLSRSTRGVLRRDSADLSALAEGIRREFVQAEPERRVTWEIASGLIARGDVRMLEVALRNLLGNAWKFTAHTAGATIRVYGEQDGTDRVFCVADNGAGFDMAHAEKLFQPFQRLHRQDEFAGIGIGLATVQRIVRRHGGEIRATASPGRGATFRFSLPARGEQ